MNRMKTLKIGGHDVRVIWEDDPPKMAGFMGTSNNSWNAIRVNTLYPESQQVVTLLHEIIHHVMSNLGLTYSIKEPKEPHTEKTVEGIAQGLYQVMHDNKLKF